MIPKKKESTDYIRLYTHISHMYLFDTCLGGLGKVPIALFYLPTCAFGFLNQNHVALWTHFEQAWARSRETLKLFFLNFISSFFCFQS